MEKLGMLSINIAKRKNHCQSANVFSVEQQYEDPTQFEDNDLPQ